jgi:KDO2-lipid IV(A) lauroyltransferase
MASRSRTLDFLVYVIVRFLICVVQAVPWDVAFAGGRFVAWLAYQVNVRHRRVAADNLRMAFPHLSDRQVDRLVRRVYRHFVTMIIEIISLPRKMHLANHEKFIVYARKDDYYRGHYLFKSGRPLLVVTGHFGNWEVFNYVCGLVRYNADIVARALDNPYLDALVRRFRADTGQRILDKNTDYDKIAEAMSSGKALGTLGDQDAGKRGLFVDFFGQPASTNKAIALLSLQYQAPILVMSVARVAEPMRYHMYLDDVIFPEEYDRDPDAVRSITQRFTTALEKRVRQFPDQYFWLHRRWKTQTIKKRKVRRRAA